MDIEALKALEQTAIAELQKASSDQEREAWRVKYLGRKSELALFLRSLADKTDQEKRTLGPRANGLRKVLEAHYAEKQAAVGSRKAEVTFDVTQPGTKHEPGHLHPLTVVSRDILRIFMNMGFDVATGPEIESAYFNFDALNIPAWHPARETMDTMWLDLPELAHALPEKGKQGYAYPAGYKFLLRTHTSPIQVRYMQTHEPPLRMVVGDGRAFRNEATDARHEFQLNQLEGLMIGKDVSIATLRSVIHDFFKQFFGPEVKMRMVPSFYPFVEPGVDITVSCIGCNGKNKSCKICGGLGWLEVAGAGMVHPNVLKAVGIDSKKWQGFAFGFGVDRLAMTKYAIQDIRLFMSGDERFIKQF